MLPYKFLFILLLLNLSACAAGVHVGDDLLKRSTKELARESLKKFTQAILLEKQSDPTEIKSLQQKEYFLKEVNNLVLNKNKRFYQRTGRCQPNQTISLISSTKLFSFSDQDKIYISTGFLSLIDHVDQLIFVLAHEHAHLINCDFADSKAHSRAHTGNELEIAADQIAIDSASRMRVCLRKVQTFLLKLQQNPSADPLAYKRWQNIQLKQQRDLHAQTDCRSYHNKTLQESFLRYQYL